MKAVRIRKAAREDPIDIGTQRVARAEGSFSFSHAYVADVYGIVAGMLLSHRLPFAGRGPAAAS